LTDSRRSLVAQRVAEAEWLTQRGAPTYAAVVALQAAIELYVDIAADEHAIYGPFSRADNPHERRAETARILAATGCIADDTERLVRDLRRWSAQTRYGTIEVHPASLAWLIANVRVTVQESGGDIPAAA
jgi:hypothetical protein